MVYMNQIRINIPCEIILILLNRFMHGRELSKELKIPLTTIQRNLLELKKQNIVRFNQIGRNKAYSISNSLAAYNAVLSAEYYKLSKLIANYPSLEPIIRDIKKVTKSEMVVLFGSYAKLNAKKDSDIDVYIDTNLKQLKEEIKLINSKLSVKIGKFDKHDLLIKEIIKNHVIIKGAETYYEKLKLFD